MKAHYVQAVLDLIRAGHSVEEVLPGLQRALATRQHEALFRPVLERVLLVLEASDFGTPVASVASEADKEALKEEITTVLASIKAATDNLEIKVDPTLVGGVLVRSGHTLVDRSYKNALVTLYRNITT